ncbi:MAG TPA: hypothetical protein PKL57_16205, partial [Candidatus Wallbacteria bacterium]|nr:hypothetical protein [Candidatus Wallbacteria bacterium]
FKGLVLAEQGLISTIKHKFVESLKCIDKALELDPVDPDLLKDRAKVLLNVGDTERSLICYLKAYSIAPDDPVIISALAKLYRKLGQFNESLYYYKKLLEIQSDNSLVMEIEYVKSRLDKS